VVYYQTGTIVPGKNESLPEEKIREWHTLVYLAMDRFGPEGNGEIYLTRLHLFQTPWFSCMLHWILRADPQPDLHDHPNAFMAIVIRGGYEEEIPKPGSEPERTTSFATFAHELGAIRRE